MKHFEVGLLDKNWSVLAVSYFDYGDALPQNIFFEIDETATLKAIEMIDEHNVRQQFRLNEVEVKVKPGDEVSVNVKLDLML